MAWQKLLLPGDVLQIRKNSGTYNSARQKLNFIEGTNIILSVNDDGSEIDTTIGVDANVQDAVSKKHNQNTDTGTTATSFSIGSDGTNNETLKLYSNTSGDYLQIQSQGTYSTITQLGAGYLELKAAGTSSGDYILFTLGSNEKMRIANTGTVTIQNKLSLDTLIGLTSNYDLDIFEDPGSTQQTNIKIHSGGSGGNLYYNIGVGGTNNDIEFTTDYGDKYVFDKTIVTSGNLNASDIKLTGGIIYPSSDSTTGIQFNKADGTTNVMTIDTTNKRIGIGTTPSKTLHLASTGDVSVWLEADTDNSGEDDNPYIKLTQDNNLTRSIIGMVGTAGNDPEDNSYTGTTANSLLIGTQTNNTVQIGTYNAVRLTIDTAGYITPSVGYKSSDGTAGMNTTWTVGAGDSVTIKDGLITAISSG